MKFAEKFTRILGLGLIATVLNLCSVSALLCNVCERSACQTPTGCPGGLTLDHCSCCPVCAKSAGEACGGMHGLKGKCDTGLICVIDPDSDSPITGHEIGICQGKNWYYRSLEAAAATSL